MPHCTIDHLTVTAPTLAAGVAYVQEKLGVAMETGGEHPRMGTHNALRRLGERLFLEVIAVNPAAPVPGRRRWFDLDAVTAATPSRLAAWVARTDDIEAAAGASPLPLGRVQPMSRGTLQWQISIPDDGSRPLDGVLPMLIQWELSAHPADSLADSGCRLQRLEGFHARADLAHAALDAIGLAGEYTVSSSAPGAPPHLVAHIQTPHGLRQL